MIAREIPREEMKNLGGGVEIPIEVLVYGATCIHHSKRPLLNNYFNYIEKKESVEKRRGLFVSEPADEDSHYQSTKTLTERIFSRITTCLLLHIC